MLTVIVQEIVWPATTLVGKADFTSDRSARVTTGVVTVAGAGVVGFVGEETVAELVMSEPL